MGDTELVAEVMSAYRDKMLVLINRGGFTSTDGSGVYRTHPIREVCYAVKLIAGLAPTLNETKRDRDALIREYAKLVVLDNSRIVRQYGFGDDGVAVFFVMELCEQSLHKRLYDYKLSENDIRHYLMQILEGLMYLQMQGIMHLDIKPKNILLTKDDDIKIADFGLSRSISTISSMSKYDGRQRPYGGTPGYIAPEVEQRHKPLLVSDVWSVAVTVYEMKFQSRPTPSGPKGLRFGWSTPEADIISPGLKRLLDHCFTTFDVRPNALFLSQYAFVQNKADLSGEETEMEATFINHDNRQEEVAKDAKKLEKAKTKIKLLKDDLRERRGREDIEFLRYQLEEQRFRQREQDLQQRNQAKLTEELLEQLHGLKIASKAAKDDPGTTLTTETLK